MVGWNRKTVLPLLLRAEKLLVCRQRGGGQIERNRGVESRSRFCNTAPVLPWLLHWVSMGPWPCSRKTGHMIWSYQTSPARVRASVFCLSFYYTNATNSVFARLNWRLSCLGIQEQSFYCPVLQRGPGADLQHTPSLGAVPTSRSGGDFSLIHVLKPAGLPNQRWSYKPEKLTTGLSSMGSWSWSISLLFNKVKNSSKRSTGIRTWKSNVVHLWLGPDRCFTSLPIKKARPSLFWLLLGSSLTTVPVVAGSGSQNQEWGHLTLPAIKRTKETACFLVSH